jgi:hypothetical protein
VPWGWLYKSLRHLKSALPVLIPMLDLKSTQFDGGLEFYWWRWTVPEPTPRLGYGRPVGQGGGSREFFSGVCPLGEESHITFGRPCQVMQYVCVKHFPPGQGHISMTAPGNKKKKKKKVAL